MINVSTATAHSVNTVYAAINEKVGPQHTRDVAVCAGLPPKTQGLDENYSNILGPSSPHPIDMASAYATIAAKGVYREPYWISRIHPYGEAPRNYSSDDEERFDEGVIADATYAMQQVVRRGSGAYARSLGRPAAGKTGTSEGNRSAWFVGFTPQMSTAVAMYRIGRNGEALPLRGWGPYAGREITGGSYPVQLWTAFMSTALRGEPVVPFPRPALGGEDLNPRPTPTTTPSPTGLPSPSPTTPSPTPSVTLPSPTPSVTRPTPTVTRPTPA
jgi:membrane peptidoglycan carboxypeptidase